MDNNAGEVEQNMNFHFILTEPAVPGNIGSSARAIKTMGFDSLRLVNPCDHLCDEARWMAHASNDILEKGSRYFRTLFENINSTLLSFTVECFKLRLMKVSSIFGKPFKCKVP